MSFVDLFSTGLLTAGGDQKFGKVVGPRLALLALLAHNISIIWGDIDMFLCLFLALWPFHSNLHPGSDLQLYC